MKRCVALAVFGIPLVVMIFSGPGVCGDYLEEMLGDAEAEDDYTQFLNLLDTALRRPVNLLSADRAEIGALPWMSPWLADSVVALRERGDLRSVDDLAKIRGVDGRLLDLLRPLILVEPARKVLPPISGNLRARVVASPPTSAVERLKTYALCRFEVPGLAAGYLVEKDKGETQLNDFQAFYLEKTWTGGEVILGDFTIASGHGLVLSNPYRQSPSTVDPWRFSRGAFGLNPMSSVEENFALRGAGVELATGNLGLCAGLSRAKVDALLNDRGTVTSVDRSGVHVGRSELSGEDALGENSVAAAARLRLGTSDITLSLLGESLDRDLALGRGRRAKDAVRLTGGLDLTMRSGETMVFAEGALAQDGGAAVGGLALDRANAEVMVLGRVYGDEYFSLHGRPFGFYSATASGERGLYTGLTLKSAGARLAVGNDVHSRLGTVGTQARPSGSQTSADFSLRADDFTFTLAEKLTVGEEPPEDSLVPAALALAPATLPDREAGSELAALGRAGGTPEGTEETRRLRSRLDVEYRPGGHIRLRARYECLTAREAEGRVQTRSASDLVRFDVSADRLGPAALDAGFEVFEVEDYAARIYQYEVGLPRYPTLALLKSDGSRWYGVLTLDLRAWGKLAAKYGVTTYDDGEKDSSLMASYTARF